MIRFTARDGDIIDVTSGQSTGDASWVQTAAKTDGDGFVEGTFTVEFMREGLPANGFDLNMKNQDGGRPALVPEIQAKVDAARIVVKIIGAGNYTPTRGTEVGSENLLRSATSDVVYFRDGMGNLYFNTGTVDSQQNIPLTPGAPLQTTYVSRTVDYGTTIEAEEFDNGVDGIAYHDSDATNSLGSFRSNTGVDVTTDATSTKVGDIADGEWLEYTAEIVANAYSIGVNVSSTNAGGQVRILAGVNNSVGYLTELGIVDVPDTGGIFSTVGLDVVDLAPFAGSDSVIRLEFIGGGFEVDSVQFAEPIQSAYVDRTITADLTTTRIELEEYDNGGQQVAYYDDSTAADSTDDIDGNNASNEFRTDEDVDTHGDILTNDVKDGEWLEYTADIHGGMYDVTLRKAWGGDNARVKLFIGNSNSASATELTGLGEFVLNGAGEFFTLEDIDLSPWAGRDRVIRIEIVDSYMGLDYLDFVSKTQTAPTADIVDVTPDPRNTNAGEVTINFDEDVTGVDISDLTLTRAGNAIDISGLTLTQFSPRQYSIDLSTVTTTGGDYELMLNSTGSGIADIAGNALATDAADQFMVEITDQDGPQVESVVVNDGSAQRSMVSEITVTFSEQVNGVDASAFILMNTTTNTQVVPTVTTQLIDGKTVATLTFSGSGISGGSLADGNYQLTTVAGSTSDAAGNQLDGNGDGTSGDNAIEDFFRFYGDVDGDRDVDRRDLLFFGRAYVKSWFNLTFDSAFDADGDGDADADADADVDVDGEDLFAFLRNFNKTLPR